MITFPIKNRTLNISVLCSREAWKVENNVFFYSFSSSQSYPCSRSSLSLVSSPHCLTALWNIFQECCTHKSPGTPPLYFYDWLRYKIPRILMNASADAENGPALDILPTFNQNHRQFLLIILTEYQPSTRRNLYHQVQRRLYLRTVCSCTQSIHPSIWTCIISSVTTVWIYWPSEHRARFIY